eukprot:218536-Lingulodinium_polyedra.AAC.1
MLRGCRFGAVWILRGAPSGRVSDAVQLFCGCNADAIGVLLGAVWLLRGAMWMLRGCRADALRTS